MGAWVGEEPGGLLVFWIALGVAGIRAVIAATLLFVLADGIRRLVRVVPAVPPPWGVRPLRRAACAAPVF